jgi:hypothetical protein
MNAKSYIGMNIELIWHDDKNYVLAKQDIAWHERYESAGQARTSAPAPSILWFFKYFLFCTKKMIGNTVFYQAY